MPIIRCEDVWKLYQRGAPRRSLREATAAWLRWSQRVRPPDEDPAAFWALQGVSVEVTAGERLGFIGPNGAGKTTMLRLLAGITTATRGAVRVRGRVASLIELGAGFHPELTGRENIYLNGAILGLTRAEVRRQLDAIVAFAEVEEFLDVPLKRYSSGMAVRLGFGVAAHVHAGILLMDEVLSVGDARFQRRCLERMRELCDAGTTVVLVSHNLSTVAQFCTQALWFHRGRVVGRGPASQIVDDYVNASHHLAFQESAQFDGAGAGDLVRIERLRLLNRAGMETRSFLHGDDLRLQMVYRCHEEIVSPAFTLTVRGGQGRIFQASMLLDGRIPPLLKDTGVIECRFRGLPLVPGSYHIVGSVRAADGVSYLMQPQVIAVFLVEEDMAAYEWRAPNARAFLPEAAPVAVPYEWRFGGDLEGGGSSPLSAAGEDPL